MPELVAVPADQGPMPLQPLKAAARLSLEKILNPRSLTHFGGITNEAPVLVLLAAGRGTRFGDQPKCIQLVDGTPLARHTIDAFRGFSPSPVICIVHHKEEEVSCALGPDNIYVHSDNPTGGTAFAAYEALSVPGLLEKNPLLIVGMGDRVVPSLVFRRLYQLHRGEGQDAGLTMLTAYYDPPRHLGTARVRRDEAGQVLRVEEDKDIAALPQGPEREALTAINEGNCSVYCIRARDLYDLLQNITNENAQGQYYLTEIVPGTQRAGREIRSLSTYPGDCEYPLLCADITRPPDLNKLVEVLAANRGAILPDESEVLEAARQLARSRPEIQVASIARQLGELVSAAAREELGFLPDRPVAIGIAGGRLRLAFMHPDMHRFYGPAWQMPTGASDVSGEEQIVLLMQESDDRRIHLYSMDPAFRENVASLPADHEAMYPGDEIADVQTYQGFGTRMSTHLLLSLGYFSDAELEERRRRDLPLPPPALWIRNNMRRPFTLVGNAIASLRTLRTGEYGARVQNALGRNHFRGVRIVSTGSIPPGGFAGSSALTLATKNALNALFSLGLPSGLLSRLTYQAAHGTGDRTGSLDQATLQTGEPGQGALISSNPAANYTTLGVFPVPHGRLRLLFPYSVDPDRHGWQWSAGCYAETSQPGQPLTTGEMRRLTRQAAAICGFILHLPLHTSFFSRLEADLLNDGILEADHRAWVCQTLRQVPLLISGEELRARCQECLPWYGGQLVETGQCTAAEAPAAASAALEQLFSGWRDPVLPRREGQETGVPLRAMLAYLFGEVAKGFYLIHHQHEWIETVQWSQRGDRWMEIDPDALPPRREMLHSLPWENGVTGPALLEAWLRRLDALPFDYNAGLDDDSLRDGTTVFHRLPGSSFFRGLALIDLAEAMLLRAFGRHAVAVRINAAGQGHYFQVHVDTRLAAVEEVKSFLRQAFYRRFELHPQPDFVEPHPGGSAIGLHLNRYDALPRLMRRLNEETLPGS